MRESLTYRAAWVAVAAVGFWVLAIGLTLGLVGGGAAILQYAPDYSLAAFVAFGLAGALAFGFLPRVSLKKKEDETSPPLGASDHPRLRGLANDVATRAGARLPDALYVAHDANAFAGERRVGWFEKQSVVGIGLPLLAVLTEKEVGAVLAHEMGHHVAGDVSLGPWVHRTRRAIARAVDRLEGSSFWFHLPFIAYADFFMKTSVRISRAQELEADAVSARVASPSAAASALRKTEVLSAAWHTYFHCEVLPVLAKGRLPPLLDGFERYWVAARTPDTPAFRALSATINASHRPRHDDTHPPLAERILALGDPPATSDAIGSALGLLDDVGRVEERVLRELLRDRAAVLRSVAWEVVVDEVWLPRWREVLAAHSSALKRLTAATLPQAFAQWQSLAAATRSGLAILSPEAERKQVAWLLETWLIVRLADRGFRIDAQPGLTVVAERDGRRLEPHEIVTGMQKAKPEGWAEWEKTCEECGL